MNLTLTLESFLGSAPNSEELMLRFAQCGTRDLLSQRYEVCGDEAYHFIGIQSDAILLVESALC